MKKIITGILLTALVITGLYFVIGSSNDELLHIEGDKGKWDIEKFYTEFLENIHSNQDNEESVSPEIPDGAGGILPLPDDKELPAGAKVLKVTYINQGNYPNDKRGTDGKGDSIKASGCIDCSAVMIANYINKSNLNIVDISKKYVSKNMFNCSSFFK